MKTAMIIAMALLGGILPAVAQEPKAWIGVSADGKSFTGADGGAFFWQGDTGWLLPERLDRGEVTEYLDALARQGYNVVQVQTVNDVPAHNAYGRSSMPAGEMYDRVAEAEGDSTGYWRHVDYIVDEAARRGINVAMVPVWGGLVKGGKMDREHARRYGRFLGERYGARPNVVWMIGGDIRGDVKPEVWRALAEAIKEADRGGHLMTFHPRGRTSSVRWWNDAPWLDFNMFQSGHRRTGQHRGEQHDPGDFEEANWRYVDEALAARPLRPVIDGEPSYEGIPQGLHDPTEPRWDDRAVRRYAYWSVFHGAAGHTYGNNSIMQFYEPGLEPAYSCDKPWREALEDPGFGQMRHLTALMKGMNGFMSRRPAREAVLDRGTEADAGDGHLAAIASDSCLMVYNYTGRPMRIDVSGVAGSEKEIAEFNPADGGRRFVGVTTGRVVEYSPTEGRDCVLIITTRR